MGEGGGDKKNQSWPGDVQFKICSEKVLFGIALPVSRPDKRSKLLIIEG